MANLLTIRPEFGLTAEKRATFVAWFTWSTEPTNANLATYNAAVNTWWDDAVGGGSGRASWPQTVNLVACTVQVVQPAKRQAIRSDFFPALTGLDTVGGDFTGCPPGCSVACSHYSALATLRGKGRNFFPPPNRQRLQASGFFVDAAGFATTMLTRMANLYRRVEIAGISRGLVHVVYSRADDVARPVTQYGLGLRIDTRRTRLGGETSRLFVPAS